MNWDLSILHFFNRGLVNPVLDSVMIFATVWGLWLQPVIAIALYWRGHRQASKILLLALGLEFGATFLFYYLAMRPRPVDVRLLLPTPDYPSFPSGHATIAFGTATLMILLLPQFKRFAPRRNFLLASGALFGSAFLVTLSRLYLGHHHPTDVLGGAALGASIGAAVYGLTLPGESWVRRLRWLLWPQIALVILVTEMAYLNLLPGNLLNWPMADKVLHFTLFGAVTFWLNLWFQGWSWRVKNFRIPLAILIPITLALIEEGFQALSPVRTASLVDLSADAAGMLFFYMLSERLQLSSSLKNSAPGIGHEEIIAHVENHTA